MKNNLLALIVWLIGVSTSLAWAQTPSTPSKSALAIRRVVPMHRTDLRPASGALPETEQDWIARTEELGGSVDRATTDRTERAFLIVTAREESGLARFVWFDWEKCRKKGSKWCDGGKSFGIFQLQDTRRDLALDEQTARALARYRLALGTCKTLEGAIAQYATGRSCTWDKAEARAAAVRKVSGLL